MKIKIEVLGLPALAEALEKRETELDVPGGTATAGDVIEHLIREVGPSVRAALYGERGSLDPTIQIALNGRTFISSDRLDTPLKEGDTLTFMLLMAGGGRGVRP